MADRPLTPPLVSVNIPCYRQLDLARKAIDSLRAQTLDDIEITLFDDGASQEYRDYVRALGDPRVRYVENPVRLGAMGNMFQAVRAGRGRYTIAFHEDDLASSRYLETMVSILEREPRCGFAAGLMHLFTGEPPPGALTARVDSPSVIMLQSPADFLRQAFRGVEVMFGSVVYRRAALDGITPETEEFAMLADRPFLLRILERWSGAIVRDPLVWYRTHGHGDDRHVAMNGNHVLRLLRRYRSAFPARLSPEDRALFYDYTGYWLFTLYRLVPPASRPSLRRFVFRAWREGLYDPRWSRGYGRKRLVGLMLTGRS